MKPVFQSRKETIIVIATLVAHLALLSTQIPKVSSTPLMRAWAMGDRSAAAEGSCRRHQRPGGLWEDYVRLRYDKEEHERLKSRVEDYQRTVLVYQEEIRRLNRLEVLDHVKAA